MSADTREDILEQLYTLLGGTATQGASSGAIPGILSVWRDRGDLPEQSELPGIFLLDGGEKLYSDVPDMKFVIMPSVIMALSVYIGLVLYPRDTKANQTVNQVYDPPGPELSAYRMKILGAVQNDPTLLSIVGGIGGSGRGGTGQIIYRGMDTDMQPGGDMAGTMIMHWEFRYVLPATRPQTFA